MKNVLLFGFLSICLCLASCGSDDGPEINITSPTDGDTFAPGDIISMTGSVTDDVEVASLSIAIDGGLLDSSPIDLSGLTDLTNVPLSGINITLDAATAVGDYNITLTATDNDGNSESEEVGITVQ